jgi:putative membrane protein
MASDGSSAGTDQAAGDPGAEERGARQWFGLYLRGMAMGVAELVPGVSGGTIAFVTGIYDELVHTLAGVNFRFVGHFRRGLIGGIVEIWRDYNLSFLLVLGFGMVTSVVLLAQALAFALENVRPVIWSFFLGVIAFSVWMLGRGLPGRSLAVWFPVGLAAGVGLFLLEPFSGSQATAVFFVVGAIGVCAWILPAVSGSFILLTLGYYEPVIHALAAGDFLIISVFLAGCAAGLLAFSRLLSLLLRRWRTPLLSLLTGFMVGASAQLWPWQAAGSLLTPAGYAAATGQDAFMLMALAGLVAGGAVILGLSRLEQ